MNTIIPSPYTFILSLVLLCLPFFANASVFISAEELNKNLSNPKQLILDIRSQESYRQGHIPGAINIPHKLFVRTGKNNIPLILKPVDFKLLMRNNGIKNEHNIIIYDDLANLESSHIYWMLDFYGQAQHSILNGGYQAWLAKDFLTEQTTNKLAKSNFSIVIHPEKMASKFEVFMTLKSDQYVIIDARPPEQFSGKTDPYFPRKGHIPTAINIPWFSLMSNRGAIDLYTRKDDTSKIKPTAQLAKILAGIPQDKKIILYCNTGSEASVLYTVLQKSNRSTQIFDGSWAEWQSDPKMPVFNPSAQ